jgi:YihY family inner membrane protein
VSSANPVPETYDLSGDDAWSALRHTGVRRLIRDAFIRLRASDGFSHARSMAFVALLVVVQGLIAVVGLASLMRPGGLGDLIPRTLREAAPGPAGQVLTQAVDQAHRAGGGHHWLALIVGLGGALISGATLMGQMERALNRLYGIERDRASVRKYTRAFVLAVSAGTLVCLAFVAIVLGRQVAASLGSPTAARVWGDARWPIAIVLVTLGLAAILRWSPRRHQPKWSWLTFGAALSVGMWVIASLLLGWFFGVSTTFGETYGPLAGIVALLLWAYLSSVAILLGASVAVQLEAVRAGVASPRRLADPESPTNLTGRIVAAR